VVKLVNPFLIDDTYTLLSAVEKIEQPLSFLWGRFFGRTLNINTDYVAIESRSEGRLIAPMVSKGQMRGVDINRGKAQARAYKPLTFAPRRTIGLGDLQKRLFGEIPNLYNKVTPAERAAKLQAEDMADLLKLHANRREQLASELLQTGKLQIKAYADDGKIAEVDEIDYNCGGNIITPAITWDNPNATIYDDLMGASERIQRRCGIVPTVAICGKNVEKYLLNNTELNRYLMVPLRENMNFASWAPSYTSPECRYIGRVQALNLEFYSYMKTYLNENLQLTPYINDDTVIIASGNLGRTIYTPITLFSKESGWQTISAPIVPKYFADEDANTLALTLYSSYVIVPDFTESWVTLKVK
jgi:hypothetical protein